ncbi:hypothetical protein PS862_05059 [Pseudomonas fluorescens]|uniref:VCBS repeat-containing protein n=1 Tax=Pseudomonas fluorescens TaxID=294 RepID=A0A5E7P6J8_PSEFL|nr:hypothetical protein [Pseudomonas fluorescens]VVP44440.1 hypothetical protein PS862_05059 [Pseudomonas fluorescens]
MIAWISAAFAAMVSLAAHATAEVAPSVEIPFNNGAEAVTVTQSIKGPLTAQNLSSSLVDEVRDSIQPFDQTLDLQGIRFHVTTALVDGNRVLYIAPQGLEIDNSKVAHPLAGNIVRAQVADLDRDGSPEIYVFVRSPGRGMAGELVAYSANRKKSLSEIYLPPVSDNPKIAEGYQGEDEFALMENALVQRFPVYEDADAGAERTGKMRQVQYRLIPGEAGWVLRVFQVTQY